MKKQQMIILLFSVILIPFAVMSGENTNGITASGIALEGEFKTGGLRSGGDAITVEIQGSMIMATFHKDLGIIQVTLSNDMGVTVFESKVNTSVQQQVFVLLSGLPSCIYTITFSNGLGAMYGDFEI